MKRIHLLFLASLMLTTGTATVRAQFDETNNLF